MRLRFAYPTNPQTRPPQGSRVSLFQGPAVSTAGAGAPCRQGALSNAQSTAGRSQVVTSEAQACSGIEVAPRTARPIPGGPMTADDILDDVLRREGQASAEEIVDCLVSRGGAYVSASALASAIRLAFMAQAFTAGEGKPYADGANVRNYECAVAGCDRKAYAKGYCNAHYLRNRHGKDMSAPIRGVDPGGKCSVCERKRGGKGGWGMCPAHYGSARRRTAKTVCVMWLGVCCQDCGVEFPIDVYDFHHICDDKEASISMLLANGSPEAIADEVKKCVLLCANCHRIRHSETHSESD